MNNETLQIRWHGRGGQGAITAAKIVASAAFESGFSGVTMAPTFGTERRGAPVSTSLKLSKKKINDLSPIEEPDIVIVLDHLILEEIDVTAGLKQGGLIVLNTPKKLDAYEFNNFNLAISDVTQLSSQAGLKKGIVNSGIIGSLAKAHQIIPLELLLDRIKAEFKGMRPKENAQSALLNFENTEIRAY